MGPWRVLLVAAALGAAAACARRAAGPPPRPKVEFAPISEAEAAKVTNPHDGPGGKPLCQRCHEGAAPATRAVNADAISLCSECHDVGLMRHPFRMEAPASATGLPLIGGRLVACHTCHEPHDVKAIRGGLRAPYKELCVKCHVKHGQKTTPPGHPAPGAPGAGSGAHDAPGAAAAPAAAPAGR